MSIHLAGGIRNPKSTSYVNCTLQMLLHFHPFIELLELQHSMNDNPLVKILFNSANKIHSTENSISADTLISFFNIDPKLFSDIITFLTKLLESLPSDFSSIIKLDDISESFEANNTKMIIRPMNTNEQQASIDEFISIGENKYFLHSITQISGNAQFLHDGHYSILLRDNQGWIQCNDTSVISIQDESQIDLMIHDEKSFIELLSYVSDLDLIDFNRRQVKFSTMIRSSPTFSSDSSTRNSPLIKKVNLFPPISSVSNGTKYVDQISSSSSSDISIINDNIHDEHAVQKGEQQNKALCCKFFDGKIMKIAKEEEFDIINNNYKTTAEKVKNDWEIELHDHLQYKFFVNSSFVDKIPDISAKNVSVIYERNAMLMFNSFLINQISNPITIEFIVLRTEIHFSGKFMGKHDGFDLESYVKTFYSEILNVKTTNINIFPIFKGKVFKFLKTMQMKKMKEILKTDELQIAITINEPNPHELISIQVPVFETQSQFSLLKEIEHTVNIGDTGQYLIDSAKESLKERPLQITYFDEQNNRFMPIRNNEYLIHIISDYDNIRIQKRIETDEITFVPKNIPGLYPFSYPLKQGQSLNELSKAIQKYINFDTKIVLSYNKENSKNTKKIPYDDHKNGIFSFMFVENIE